MEPTEQSESFSLLEKLASDHVDLTHYLIEYLETKDVRAVSQVSRNCADFCIPHIRRKFVERTRKLNTASAPLPDPTVLSKTPWQLERLRGERGGAENVGHLAGSIVRIRRTAGIAVPGREHYDGEAEIASKTTVIWFAVPCWEHFPGEFELIDPWKWVVGHGCCYWKMEEWKQRRKMFLDALTGSDEEAFRTCRTLHFGFKQCCIMVDSVTFVLPMEAWWLMENTLEGGRTDWWSRCMGFHQISFAFVHVESDTYADASKQLESSFLEAHALCFYFQQHPMYASRFERAVVSGHISSRVARYLVWVPVDQIKWWPEVVRD